MVVAEIVKGAPYSATATTERVQTLPDGNRITQTNRATIYRDSEGRVRREQTLDTIGPWTAREGPRTIVTISDPTENVVYVLDPMDHQARVLAAPPWIEAGSRVAEPRPLTARRLRGFPGMDPGTVTTEDLGEQQFYGVSAEGTRTMNSIPAGTIGNDFAIEMVSEEWYSSDLHAVVLSRHNDPLVGETVYRLENISREEPNPSLFTIPAEYEVVEGPAPAFPPRDGRPPPPPR